MAQVDHIDDIQFSTSFGIDKMFLERYTGQFSVPVSPFPTSLGTIATTTIAQPYGENVLPIMQFSINGTDWLEAGSMRFNPAATLETNFSATCYTTSSSIVVVAQNYTGSVQTCYYRILLVSDE